ncbi:hypothetical protein EXM52_16140 [Clostridium botulinum]|nr:hypothetical protein [Clostridium botulinum]HDK7182959.1 hypothetical protein [Clostridium botulinum]HDK7218120.1 hypothetical protein [Clostridium botulinum]HDK7236522.1 hypothetical protein [Clostridium botulinum]HDK7251200.1 hypothetical protein [Clostridium botulinum]
MSFLFGGISLEDIKLLKIDYEYLILMSIEGMEKEELTGYKIEFNYKGLKECKIRIKSNKELSIEEMKERIWREIQC